MALVVNEEQKMLKSSAREFFMENSPVGKLRILRDKRDEVGFDRTLWHEMATMGWTALTIPEAYGGLDFGYVGLGQILEEMGRTLTASPMVSTVLLSATSIHLGGNALQKESLLPKIAEGLLVIAFAIDEGTHHNPSNIQMTADKIAEGYVLNGTKVSVMDGHIADMLIVAARTHTGTQLFVVDANRHGMGIERIISMDSRNYATIVFKGVKVSDDELLSGGLIGDELLEKTLDIARIGLACEMLGGIQEAFERTISYLQERRQFGVPIGSFQALQHRAAHMFCEIELCKSVVLKALKAIDNDTDQLSRLASLAKAKVGQTYQLISNESIQMFGGIGMTDDEEIGFFLKRAKVAQRLLGDSNYHLDRMARFVGI